MYAPPIYAGQAIRAGIIGEVILSKSQKFSKGDRLTVGSGQWAEYLVVKDDTPGIAVAA